MLDPGFLCNICHLLGVLGVVVRAVGDLCVIDVGDGLLQGGHVATGVLRGQDVPV